MWQVGDGLFLALKMSQNSIASLPRFIGHDLLALNTGDELGRITAAAVNLSVYVEDAL